MDTIKVTKEDIIRTLSEQTLIPEKTVIELRDAFDVMLLDLITEADNKHDVCVELLNGVKLVSKYQPEQTKKNNLTGKECVVSERYKPKISFTNSYLNSLIIK